MWLVPNSFLGFGLLHLFVLAKDYRVSPNEMHTNIAKGKKGSLTALFPPPLSVQTDQGPKRMGSEIWTSHQELHRNFTDPTPSPTP